jgi:hypothetical protein
MQLDTGHTPKTFLLSFSTTILCIKGNPSAITNNYYSFANIQIETLIEMAIKGTSYHFPRAFWKF